MSAIITPNIFVTGKELKPAVLKPKIYVSGTPKMPAVLSPQIYVSATPKIPAIISPKIYVSAAPKPPAFITPQVYVTGIPIKPAVITPQVFITLRDSRETAIADTLQIVKNPSWAVSDTAIADTSRRLVDVAIADTLLEVSRLEITCADTLIRYPHDLTFDVRGGLDTFKDYDVTAFSVTLNERTLSDTFSLELAQALEINDAVKGQLLDYPFSFLVEETSRQDLIQTVKGMYDIDKLLYTQILFSQETEVHEKTAAEYTEQLAEYFGLTANIKIQNFTPSDDSADTNITYGDLLNTLFSWTSKLPQRQINVFIRGGVLHCIQRGLEDSVLDITDLPHSRPTINKKLIRTMYQNPTISNTGYDTHANSGGNGGSGGSTEFFNDYSEEEIAVPFSGTISFSDNGSSTSLKYSKGLLVSEESTTSNDKIESRSKTTYQYTEVLPEGTTDLAIFLHKLVGDFYLASKETAATVIQHGDTPKKIQTSSATEYIYTKTSNAELYLCKEYETNSKVEYELGDSGWELMDEETNDRQTFHTPVGNGWYATSVYVNGEPQGSSLSQGKPGNKISPYTINQVQKTFSNRTVITHDGGGDNNGGGGGSSRVEIDNGLANLSPIGDVSFPVYGVELLRELVEAYYWLNRKTQETVSVDITDEIKNGVPTNNHIIDFTERVKLDGNEYFLVSNQIRFTPRSLIQKLQLVRWY